MLYSNLCNAAILLIRENEEPRVKPINSVNTDSLKISSLLNSAFAYVNKKGEDETDLSKAIGLAQHALQLSITDRSADQQVAAYTILSQCYREKKDNTKGKQFAELAIRHLPKGANNIQAADALIEMSAYYDLADQNALLVKLDYYSKAVAILRKAAPRTKKLADALKFLGDLKNTHYEVDNAIALLKESLVLYESLGIKQLQDVYDLLGDALTSSGNTVEGLSYQLKALKLAEKYKDTSQMISTIYYRLAFAYNAINQDARTAESMEKARYWSLRNHNVGDWIMISANLGTTYNKLGRYQEAVKTCKEALAKCPEKEYQLRTALITNLLYAAVATGDLRKATPYYSQLKEITEAHNIEINTTDAAIIEYLIAKHQYKDASTVIGKLTELTKVTNSLISKQKIEHYQFQVDSAGGNFISAIEHLNRSHQYRDSLLSRNYNKQIGRMQMTFDLQKKDQDIAFKARHIDLLTHKNELQTASLHNQKVIRNLFIASVIMLVLLLGLSYNRYKIKRNANNELQEQQEEINTQNESLRQLLDERDWLLKEVHHRVKNNLQIVISLLNSQLANIKDIVALDVIRESQNRMRSISLIHQKLYQGDDLATIDARDYIREIALYLQESFDTIGRIRFTVDIEPVMLDVTHAVPIGLILNEAITNSIKYAFATQANKHVIVTLKQQPDNFLKLCIADNGKGLPDGFEIGKTKSLGMQLMSGLSKQIRAEFTITSLEGLKIELDWQKIDPFRSKSRNDLRYGVEL